MKKENQEKKMEELRTYASNKYNCDFTITDFQMAKDNTYTNILSLTDGNVYFNVFQQGDNIATDDYPQALLNQKFLSGLNIEYSSELEIYGHFMFTKGNDISLSYVHENELSTILKDYALLKIILVVKTSDNLTEHQDAIYQVYQKVQSLSPKYLDFVAIQTADTDEELNKMLTNLPAYYNSDWTHFESIKAYLSTTNLAISSVSDLMKEVK